MAEDWGPVKDFWRKYRDLLEFVGLVIVWPAGTYTLIHYFIDSAYGMEHPDAAAMLAIVGMIAWVAIKVRRG